MKKICLIILTITFFVCFASVAFAGDTVKLSATVEGLDGKTQFSKGDTVSVVLAIEDACPNFGLLIGSIEFDENSLSYKDVNYFAIIKEDEDDMDTSVYPKFINVGLDDMSNQILFWLEDSQNRMGSCRFARVFFEVKKEVSKDELTFTYRNVKARDYDEKNNYTVESVVSNKKVIVESEDKNDETIIEKEIQDKINDTRKSISEYVNQGNDKVKEEEEEKKETKKQIWSNVSSWAIKELEEAQLKGLIPETFENKDFTKPITRKDFAAVAVKLYEKLSNKEATKAGKETFNDTEDEYVLKAYSVGITEGTSKEKALFSPNNEITREQMATMMLRAINKAGINTKVDLDSTTKFVDDGEMHDWSREAIYYMSSNNIINGISTKENRFGVKNTATIDQSLAISLRTINSTK